MIFKQLFFKNDFKRVRHVQSSHKSNPWHPIKPTNPPHGTQKLPIWLMLFLCGDEIENIFFLNREREKRTWKIEGKRGRKGKLKGGKAIRMG